MGPIQSLMGLGIGKEFKFVLMWNPMNITNSKLLKDILGMTAIIIIISNL